MRGITITYKYSGPEDAWREAMETFIAAINADRDVAGKFTYQVAVADDGETRIHWGRWDSQETLKTLQSRDYFGTFAGKVREFAGGQPTNTGADIHFKTEGW